MPEKVAEELDSLLGYGFDVGDALMAIGKSYGAVLKSIERLGRRDLDAKLREWKREDANRLRHAQGKIRT